MQISETSPGNLRPDFCHLRRLFGDHVTHVHVSCTKEAVVIPGKHPQAPGSCQLLNAASEQTTKILLDRMRMIMTLCRHHTHASKPMHKLKRMEVSIPCWSPMHVLR